MRSLARFCSAHPTGCGCPANHPLLSHERVALSDVAAYPVIMLSADDMHQLTSMQWRQAGIQPNVVLTTSSIEAVRSLVGTGIGIAILPDMTYRPWSLDGDRVEMRPLGEPLPTVDVGLVWRKGSSVTDTARYFIELARDYSRTKNRQSQQRGSV